MQFIKSEIATVMSVDERARPTASMITGCDEPAYTRRDPSRHNHLCVIVSTLTQNILAAKKRAMGNVVSCADTEKIFTLARAHTHHTHSHSHSHSHTQGFFYSDDIHRLHFKRWLPV